ncbi:MAG: arginine--tRNA ligase, partial [Treponema sp.]|nr:arginine--tRNA ligase [Treponema sp.]
MADIKAEFRKTVCEALNSFIKEKAPESQQIDAETLAVQTPPDSNMGDLGIPMFVFAKSLRMAPPQIAEAVALKAAKTDIGEILAVGPYVNIKLDKANETYSILSKIDSQKENYGSMNADGKKPLEGRRVMVEFSSPN